MFDGAGDRPVVFQETGMGYHSDVAIAVSARHAHAFLRLLHRINWKHLVTQNDDGDVLLITSGKWYGGYDDVDSVMDFLYLLDDDEYMFIRVGEDRGDVDERGSYCDPFNMSVITKIECSPGREVMWPADIELAEAASEGVGSDSKD